MKWSYKTVHFELKKEGLLGSGFLDESEIEQELNEFGQAGWELVSVLEVQDGIIVFFRQPLYLEHSSAVQPVRDDENKREDDDQIEQFEDLTLEEDRVEQDEDQSPEHIESPAESEADEKEPEETGSTIGAIKIE